MISDNDQYSKKSQFKQIMKRACGDNTEPTNDNGDIPSNYWNYTKDMALNGQKKMREYQATVMKEAKDIDNRIRKTVNLLHEWSKNPVEDGGDKNGSSSMSDVLKDLQRKIQDSDNNMDDMPKLSDMFKEAAEGDSARVNTPKIVNTTVAFTAYMSQRVIMVMNKVVLPVMRKQHRSACATFIWVQSHTKAANKKGEKTLKKGKI